MQMFAILRPLFDPFLLFFSDDPILRVMQVSLVVAGAVIIFLVFFTTRDILQRTHSFLLMAFCIVLVAVLPLVGFLIYLLIRPIQTLRQRAREEMLAQIHVRLLKHEGKGERKSRSNGH